MDLGLKGKVALVTGGTHGIGLAAAVELAKEGCKVAVCSRDEVKIEQTLMQLKITGQPCLGIKADVSVKSDIDKVLKTVIQEWDTIHVLVNNVGGGGRWGKETVEETDEAVWHEVYEKNAMAAIRFTMQTIPYMRRQKWGRVITITSTLGREGGGRPWFNMAKTAQTSLMKSLSRYKYLVRDGITFNSVAPGAIMIPDTGWEQTQKEDPQGFKKMMDENYPLGRLGEPQEVAAVIAFLAAERASLVNGSSVLVDGGESKCF